MNDKNKNIIKLIISFTLIIAVLIVGIVLITKNINEENNKKENENKLSQEQSYTEENLKNSENTILNQIVSEESNTTQYTPIEKEVIDEGLINEDIVEKPLLKEDFIIEKAKTPTTKKNNYLSNYEKSFFVEGDYINVWDIDFYVEPQINKKTNENSMLYMKQMFKYNNDANELKETIMKLINDFTTDNSNIVFKRNTHVKNLYDIPSYGLRILSEDDNNFHYLHISTPYDKPNHKYITTEYIIVSKTVEQIKTKDQKIAPILSNIEDMISLSTTNFEFKKSVEESSGYYVDLTYENQNKGEESAAISSMYEKTNSETENN